MSQYAMRVDTGERRRRARSAWQSAILLFLFMLAGFLLFYVGYLWFTTYGLTAYCEQRPDVYDCGPVWPLLWRLGGQALLALVLTVAAQIPIRRVPFIVALVAQLVAIALLGWTLGSFMASDSPFRQFGDSGLF
jgi:hypothetical protein